MKSAYLNDWAESGQKGMLSDFGISEAEVEGANILVASYTYEDYSGDAYVLFERGGKLYEVFGGHCSCYGLSESGYSGETETQWKPEETSEDAIRARMVKGSYGTEDGVRAKVIEAIDNLQQNSEITKLFETHEFTSNLGVVRIEHWKPDGLVLWVGGEIVWKSF